MGMVFMILFWALGIALLVALTVWLIGRLRRWRLITLPSTKEPV